MKPSEQAKKLNLHYIGFGRYANGQNKQVAKTVNGTLVRAESKDNQAEKPVKSAIVISVNNKAIQFKKDYIISLIQTSLSNGSDVIVLATKDTLQYIKQNGLFSQFAKKITIVPMDQDDNTIKVHAIQRKIDDQFVSINFYDTMPEGVKAVQEFQSKQSQVKILTQLY